jgi:putative peptidoglycan lipid II flippase
MSHANLPITAVRPVGAPGLRRTRFGLVDDAAPSASESSENGAEPSADETVKSAKAGLVMASGTIVSRLLGLVRTVLLAAAIGATGFITDLWDLANVLPNQIYGMIAGGVFSAILVPLVIKASKAKDRGSDYLSRLVTLMTLFLGVSTVIITVAAPWIIRALATYTPEQQLVATQLAYFLLPQIFFYGMYAIIGQILNAHEKYGPFMWSPVLNNVIAIATLLLFIKVYGPERDRPHTLDSWTLGHSTLLGVGTTLGIVLQALVLLIPLRKLRLNLRPNFHFRGIGLRQTGKLAGWTVATMIVGNIPFFIYARVESTIAAYRERQGAPHGAPGGPGGGSAGGAGAGAGEAVHHVIAGPNVLSAASLLTILPHAVIAVSLATILVNRLSHAAAEDDLPRLRAHLNQGLRTVGLPMILTSVAMIVVAGPLGFIFGAGDRRSGALIGIATVLCVIAAPIYTVSVFLSRTFYIIDDAKTPFFIAVGVGAVSIGMAYATLLSPPETRIFAIALVTSLANVAGFLVNHVLLTRKMGSYDLGSVFDSYARFTVAALISAVFGIGALWLLGGYSETGWAWSGIIEAFISCAVVTLIMGTIYLALLKVSRTPELEQVLNPLIAKLRR